jgi:hypothetical protein
MVTTQTILVSRFNWPHPKWKDRHILEYQKWVEERIEIFAQYTLKSVKNCYIKPDIWFLMVDNRIVDCVSQLRSLLGDFPYRFVEYTGLSIPEAIKHELADLEFPVEIRMSRLDADDLISSDFFARIKALNISVEDAKLGVIITFPGGCNYVSYEDRFYYSSYPNNPFLTFVELINSPTDAKTVYWKMHTEMVSSGLITRYERSFHPMWSSVIHNANTANDSLVKTNTVCLSDNEYIKKKMGIY